MELTAGETLFLACRYVKLFCESKWYLLCFWGSAFHCPVEGEIAATRNN